MNELLTLIKQRRTTRKFKIDQINDQALEAILEAALYAPSAANQQSWHLTVVQNEDIKSKIKEFSREMARNSENPNLKKSADSENFDLFFGAPTYIIVSGDTEAMFPEMDCAAASENMLLMAESLDIGSCWNGTFGFLFNSSVGDQVKTLLEIPKGYKPYHGILLGYKLDPSKGALERKANTVTYFK